MRNILSALVDWLIVLAVIVPLCCAFCAVAALPEPEEDEAWEWA